MLIAESEGHFMEFGSVLCSLYNYLCVKYSVLALAQYNLFFKCLVAYTYVSLKYHFLSFLA